MKKFIMSVFAALTAVAITGCCTNAAACKKACPKAEKQCPKAKAACPKAEKCTKPCAKGKKCHWLGKWEFAVIRNGKAVALPVDHSPTLEICKKGVMKFHYVKEGKPVVVEGKWKAEPAQLTLSDISGKNTQVYTLNNDGSASFTIVENDRLPAGTKVIIRKKK